jgi:NAD(P)H-hydrate epimerase
MRKVLTAVEMREIDRLTTERFGIPSLELMENAALAVTAEISSIFGDTAGLRVAVICGKGKNGGDGAAVARLLAGMGAEVSAMLVGSVDETRGDAHINFERLKGMANTGFDECPDAAGVSEFLRGLAGRRPDVIVDAMFGTGLSRPLEGIYTQIIERIGQIRSGAETPMVVAVDLPSGLNADRVDIIGPVLQADVTVTFTAPKFADVMPPASRFCGRLVVADIGSPRELIDESPSRTFEADGSDAMKWLAATEFQAGSYKGKRGQVLFVAGSGEYSGAAVLAANASMMSGVGMVTVVTPKSIRDAVASRVLPEIIVRAADECEEGIIGISAFDAIEGLIHSGIDAVEIGSGLTSSRAETKDLVRLLIEKRSTPLVIDADGLNSVSPLETPIGPGPPVVMTPHDGEFLRLLGLKEWGKTADRISEARAFAKERNVTLLLKGERNLVASPDGRVAIVPTGNPGVGKAGGGDTLAGIVAGFVAQGSRFGMDVFESVVAAAYIAGLAGDIAERKWGRRVMLASDVRECLAEAMRSVEGVWEV